MQFRQLDSLTPGHPEYKHTKGVEATTGPLGAGMAMAVGMAMAEKFLATKYNKPDFNIVDHYTYVLCGDGDMEEGVLISRVVPEWVKKGEKKGTLLNCKKKFTHNELPAQCCVKCKKIILDI